MRRRDFLSKACRAIILMMMSGGTILLARKGKITKNTECNLSYGCGECRALSGCSLERAQKYRDNG